MLQVANSTVASRGTNGEEGEIVEVSVRDPCGEDVGTDLGCHCRFLDVPGGEGGNISVPPAPPPTPLPGGLLVSFGYIPLPTKKKNV